MNICICGGGSLGHVCIGILSQFQNATINILTNHPESWSQSILIEDIEGQKFEGHVDCVSSKAEDVIPQSDIVLFCLPGFLIETTLEKIKPYLTPTTCVGSVVCNTGFFFFAHNILPAQVPLFGFQRVPFISRVQEYGKSAKLLGYKKNLALAIENIPDKEGFRALTEKMFMTPVYLLDNYYEVSLSNSNPILHTGRLYSMWKHWNGQIYTDCIRFYAEWDEDSAQTIIDMDKEFMFLLDRLNIDKKHIPSLLSYYESTDAISLANKLRSIAAFQTILAPMKQVEQGWIPDFQSRYFTEDFPYGLRFIKEMAEKEGLQTPTIDKVYSWGIKLIGTKNV